MAFVNRLVKASANLLGFCLSFVLAVTANAQVDSISLQKAIELALSRNQVVGVADLDVRHNESRFREVQSTRFPTVALRSHYLLAPGYGYSDIVTNGGEYGLQLAGGVPLLDGGIRSAAIHEASNAVDRSSIELQKTKVDLIYEVRSAYYELAHSLSELHIRQETVRRLNDYTVFLSQLQQGGAANAGDVLKARVELNNAATELENARQIVKKNELQLNRLIGNSPEQEITIAENVMADTSSLPTFSVEHNLSVHILQLEEISSSDELRIARGERQPTLSIAGDVGFLGVQPNEYRSNLGFSVSLAVDLPLFSWGGIENRIEQKEIIHQQIEKEIEIQKRDLETQWRTTLSNIFYERNALIAYARNMGDAENNYLLAKSRFAGGSGSNLEVLDSQRLLVEVNLNYSNALFLLNVSLANAMRLSGQ